MADDRHIENRFFLAITQPISLKFCVSKQFFAEFRQRDRYPCSTDRTFWASASGAFRIVSDTLVVAAERVWNAARRRRDRQVALVPRCFTDVLN